MDQPVQPSDWKQQALDVSLPDAPSACGSERLGQQVAWHADEASGAGGGAGQLPRLGRLRNLPSIAATPSNLQIYERKYGIG